MTDKAVILAAGAGTRMRREDASAPQTEAQAATAATGIKALVPVGRPFLDYVLANLAEAGFREVCLVLGGQHDAVQDHCRQLDCKRLTIQFAHQAVPRGTADAVLAAEGFAGRDDFVVINSDNYYPTSALGALRTAAGPATVGFDLQALTQNSNISRRRLEAYAVIESDRDGMLCGIREKPGRELLQRLAGTVLISMNCWRFSPAILAACRNIDPSPRNEYEIPDAVLYSIQHLEQRYRVIPSREPVLDLSSRRDVARITNLLSAVEVRL